ncbi:hypothetical protein BC832DRAFT_561964 [Gaertneriomyces semiglobifer]|nr:hypothetical protein BC832DRAFT_561964 [Gaertneriomyces semiglobifer]
MSTVEEKALRGICEKEKGNAEFKKGNLSGALRFYHQGLLCLTGLDTGNLGGIVPNQNLDAKLKKDIQDGLKSCHLNMAACYLKLQKFEKAVSSCDKVIKIDPNNAKAHFRRGQAHFSMNDVDKAAADLIKAGQLAPNDAGIREELTKVRQKQRELDEKSRREWMGVFNKGNLSSEAS